MACARWPLHCIALVSVGVAAALSACGSNEEPPEEPAGTRVTFSFCAGWAPVWLAVQDGNDAWTRLDPRAEGLYETRFTADRGGIAYVSSGGGSLVVNYGSLAELGSIACSAGYKHVRGAVAGSGVDQAATLTLGSLYASSYALGADTFSISNVLDGPQDLFAGRFSAPSVFPDRLVIRRALDPASGSELAVIDFAAPEAFAPAVATVSVTGLDEVAGAYLTPSWYGREFSAGDLINGWIAIAPGPMTYPAVPLDRLGPGELSSLGVRAYESPGGGRSVTTYFRVPDDKVLALGPAISPPVVTWPVDASHPRPRVELIAQQPYDRMASVAYEQNVDWVSVAVTAAYLGGTPATWVLEVPDLTSVDGWDPAWGLAASPPFTWTVAAEGGVDRGLGDAVRDGDLSMSAEARGGYRYDNRAPHSAIRPQPFRGGFPRPPLRGE